ncbi:transcription initiation factor TFIID subunit 5 [Pseudohyphozyma bogoriensis]|nr:transcription initiation factor TFIID subunit 5 [Pseudohyphozyma bogoriensis]
MSAAAPQAQPKPPPSEADSFRTILDYLERHGHSRAASTLRADLKTVAEGGVIGGGKAVGLDEFADKNAPNAPKVPNQAAMNGVAQNMARSRIGPGGQVLQDAPSWEKGYEGMRGFVENSLDIHRPELHPLLLPLFVHSYLDLVLVGFRDAADHFLRRFSPDHNTTSPHVVRMLAAIRNESHVRESEDATRWRQERYCMRLSERGWGLLLGWLQGGGLAGSIEGTEARGRDRVLSIINERVKVDAFPGPPLAVASDYGLLSEMASKRSKDMLHELKLGPAPMDAKLEREVLRAVKEEEPASTADASTSAAAAGTADGAQTANANGEAAAAALPEPTVLDLTTPQANKDSALPPLVSPFPADLPPYPNSLRTIDVAREVERVREARKRIKLGAEAYQPAKVVTMGAQTQDKSAAAKPSACLFTIHDSGDSLTTAAFSEDSTLMAAGFLESYIRLWNLKGEKLPALRSDFDSDEVTDANSLKKVKQKNAPTTRKLVGHSGPIYALSFDPVPGASGPPRYLLSASQDSTIRLWSLETYTNVVAYRGHREPVWDVEWGPRGIYFASASRDRTARLWSSDKTSAIRIFAGHLSDVNCVRFHPNSLYLATGSSDRTCRLWDVQKGTCVRVFTGHRAPVMAIAMSPDGRYLASASEDSLIILWDLASGRKIKTMAGHTSSIYSLAFSAESSVLISGGADSTVRVWDVLAPPVVEPATRAVTLGALGVKRVSTVGFGGVDGGEGKPNGLLPRGQLREEPKESADLLATLATKRTPVLKTHFTPRNLVLAAGPLQDD